MLLSTTPRPLLACRRSPARRRRYDHRRNSSSINSKTQRLSPLAATSAASSSEKQSDADNGHHRQQQQIVDSDWRKKASPIKPGSAYPAREHCSMCGLCDTYYVAHVKEACSFLGDGMSKAYTLEPAVHGRNRNLDDDDELRLGVTLDSFYARVVPSVPGAQWTGIVTSISLAMLESKKVDAVVCVQSDPGDRLAPLPVVARTSEDVLASRGVKPSLSPNLSVLATIEALGEDVKKVLFVGVGCQVLALRSVQKHLMTEAGLGGRLEELFVLGTNCTDNGPREGLRAFLDAASSSPETALHYEFMQDYTVHIKHANTATDLMSPSSSSSTATSTTPSDSPPSPPPLYERVPYFSLPANDLTDVIAPSCYACFDYTNSLADVVVGYMGVPFEGGEMSQHRQHVVVRNARGRAMLAALEAGLSSSSSSSNSSSSTSSPSPPPSSSSVPPVRRLERTPTMSSRGLLPWLLSRESLVLQTVGADDEAKMGRGPDPAPLRVGRVIAAVLNFLGPKGIEFAKYSVDYHYLRNWLHVQRHFGAAARGGEEGKGGGKGNDKYLEQKERHVPVYAKKILEKYDKELSEEKVSGRLRLPGSEEAGKPRGGPRKRPVVAGGRR